MVISSYKFQVSYVWELHQDIGNVERYVLIKGLLPSCWLLLL
jgi:hypothetical protein